MISHLVKQKLPHRDQHDNVNSEQQIELLQETNKLL